ncbi:NAD(P)H-dependent oxidoreductase [Conyzicola nivalis]|uniref:NAD(P)H dehydrogenase n=1 Tax=Conyzicola nivalis TaxID=1477021 RepID=A0A916WN56_9MICO|nr:NAD(P)H-dependent oxidoreductase [Conyzicola nivalis]GGB14204.1 NAD(P)H dehydrogenase [Conyzicola nivalis]
MRTLIVIAHPDADSLTHRVAEQLRESLGTDRASIAPLAQEEFDPGFTLADRDLYLGKRQPGADVVAEQNRLDGATDVVLVFPVYWWSMPALLKGWIDRVFVSGWAFDVDDNGRIVPRLGRLRMHLLPVSGTAGESFDRHGYARSFSTQIENGIVDYCGMRRGVTAFVYDSESEDSLATGRSVESAVGAIVGSIGERAAVVH